MSSLLTRTFDALREGGVEQLSRRSAIFFKRRYFRFLALFEKINAEIQPLIVPDRVVSGCMDKVRFRFYNRSRALWNSSRDNAPRFSVAVMIFDGKEITYQTDQLLPADLRPDDSCDVDLLLEVPRRPGKYSIRVDLVRKNCYWFSEIGFAPLELCLTVEPHSVELLSRRIPTIDVTLDITNKCPLKCIQCRKTYFETFSEQQDMNFDLFNKIASEVFPYANSVMLSSAGEPLMTRNLFEAIELTKKFGVKEISFISAGFHLNPARAEKIIDSGVSRIEFSIDGASSEVYNKIRIGSEFEKVVKNIAYLNELKKNRGSRTPLLRFNFVLMKSNIHELPAFIDLAARLGVEEVQCQHMVVFVQQVKDEALIFYKAESNASILEAKRRAAAHKIRFYHPPLFSLSESGEGTDQQETNEIRDGKIWMQEDDFDFERKTHPVLKDEMQLCTDPWRKLFIDWQGQVFPCCLWKEEPIGDLRRTSFAEIWESPRYRQLREGLTTGKLGKSCAECSVITGGDVNIEQSYFFSQNSAV